MGDSHARLGNAPVHNDKTGKASHHNLRSDTRVADPARTWIDEPPPPLPPRPSAAVRASTTLAPPKRDLSNLRPPLSSTATTALSLTDIHTHSTQDGSRQTFSSPSYLSTHASTSGTLIPGRAETPRSRKLQDSSADDNASIISYAPTLEATVDTESILGDVLNREQEGAEWKRLHAYLGVTRSFDELEGGDDDAGFDFEQELNEIDDLDDNGANEEALLAQWKSKLKHFLVLSTAGKPVYTRHGNQSLVSSHIGIIQTIISFYQDAEDSLMSFMAGGTRFVILTEGPLYLVAISRLGESDSQLRAQLEAMYMQILSTLTLPGLKTLFANRPSTDLRRPLQGTEPLLSGLTDTFIRGSPSTLLGALECLKIRKSQRAVINNSLLKAKVPSLLYGLIVAGGRLVSVIRPKRHSLHPGDLQLVFNMLFEAEAVKAAGGENWIPLCLPAFNNTGFLYMYVNFLPARPESEGSEDSQKGVSETLEQIAIILISTDKESFYDLQHMRDEVLKQLEKNGSMDIIRDAVTKGRPNTTDIAPGTVLRHFLYKSRGNVQFVMSSYEPHFTSVLARRRLLSLYHNLHASVHTKYVHLKVHHCSSRDSISLAWVTQLFELYCVAAPNASKSALAQGANKIIQWVRREEERIFIIGGAVF